MNHTFTLKRLFLNVTLLAVAAGVVQAFPDLALRAALACSIFVPAILLALLLARWSRHPKAVFAASLPGVVVGWLLAPRMLINWGRAPTWWDLYVVDLQTQLVPTIIGAVVFGGLALAVSNSQRDRALSLAKHERG